MRRGKHRHDVAAGGRETVFKTFCSTQEHTGECSSSVRSYLSLTLIAADMRSVSGKSAVRNWQRERVSILLGHSSVRITERHYARWGGSRQRQLEADVSWSRRTYCGGGGGNRTRVRERPSQRDYMLSPLENLNRLSSNRHTRNGPVRLISTASYEQKPTTYPAKLPPFSPLRDPDQGRAD